VKISLRSDGLPAAEAERRVEAQLAVQAAVPRRTLAPTVRDRNNDAMQTAAPTVAERTGDARRAEPSARHRGAEPLRRAGTVGLVATVLAAFLLAASAAAGPSEYVRMHGAPWQSWIAGPYTALGLRLTPVSFAVFTLVLTGGYLLVLASATELPGRAIAAAIALCYLAVLLGPPLLSQDVYGYISFARLGSLHSLNPYTHVAAEAPADPSFPYIGWPFQHTPYGPLFTLFSYAVAPLGIGGALWAFKAIAVLTGAAAVALIARAASIEGRSGRLAAAFLGLNPVMLEFAVAGAHNDTIVLLLVCAALAVAAGALNGLRSTRRLRLATVPLAVAVGVKITAGLAIPFLVLAPSAARERLRLLGNAIGGLIVVAAIGAIGFGAGMAGFFVPLAEEQQQVSPHSIPAELARIVGLSGAPSWWRAIFLAAFAVVLLYALWRTAIGADWRVAAGWSTVALVVSTAWLLPWYAVWTLPFAAIGADRRLRIAALLLCLYALMMRLPFTEPLLG
jgi:alpha-1,6-mannosyltransferase